VYMEGMTRYLFPLPERVQYLAGQDRLLCGLQLQVEGHTGQVGQVGHRHQGVGAGFVAANSESWQRLGCRQPRHFHRSFQQAERCAFGGGIRDITSGRTKLREACPPCWRHFTCHYFEGLDF